MTRTKLAAVLLASVTSGVAAICSAPAPAAAADPGAADGQQTFAGPAAKMDWEKARAEETQARLDQDAARLEIKASQEPAWNDYAAALKAVSERPRSAAPLPPDADAAALARARADDAAAMAQKLARLADATVKLQAVLTPNQREVLNQIARADRSEFRLHRGVVIMRRGPGDEMGWGPGDKMGWGPGPRPGMGPQMRTSDGPID